MDKRTKQTKPLPDIYNSHRENRTNQNPNQNKTLPHTCSRLPRPHHKKEKVSCINNLSLTSFLESSLHQHKYPIRIEFVLNVDAII